MLLHAHTAISREGATIGINCELCITSWPRLIADWLRAKSGAIRLTFGVLSARSSACLARVRLPQMINVACTCDRSWRDGNHCCCSPTSWIVSRRTENAHGCGGRDAARIEAERLRWSPVQETAGCAGRVCERSISVRIRSCAVPAVAECAVAVRMEAETARPRADEWEQAQSQCVPSGAVGVSTNGAIIQAPTRCHS